MPSNNLGSNVSQKVLRKFAPGFMANSVIVNAVDRQVIQGEINPQTGGSVSLKRRHQFKSIRTATGDLTGQSPSNLIAGKITATISEFCTVWIEYSVLEQAILLDQLEEILMPAYEEMNTAIELETGRYVLNNSGLSLGTAGTAITKWSDVAQTGSFLTDLGVPSGKKYAIMDPWSAQALADKQGALQSGNVELIRSAWEDAQIAGNFAGVRAIMSNSLSSRTAGTAAGAASVTVKTTPTATYTSVKDTMQMTVVLTGASLAGTTLKAGDQLTFPASFWINQQTKQTLFRNGAAIPFTATVTADATAVGNDITVVVTCAPVVDATNPQYNTVSRALTAGDAVTIQGVASTTYKPSIFMHEKAIAMGTVELKPLHNCDSSVFTSEKTGLTMRATLMSNPQTNVQGMRIDILPAFAVMMPQAVGQFYGVP